MNLIKSEHKNDLSSDNRKKITQGMYYFLKILTIVTNSNQLQSRLTFLPLLFSENLKLKYKTIKKIVFLTLETMVTPLPKSMSKVNFRHIL